MTKLEQLYNSIQNLKELGVQLPDKLIEETNRVEEEIIKKDVIPLLEESISPLISQIQRSVVLVIDYIPDEPITVKLTRKRSFANQDEPIIANIDTTTFVSRKHFSISKHSKSDKTVLSVTFPDGKVVSERFAYGTLVSCIHSIGFEKVQALNIFCCGVPLVSNKKDDFYRQEEAKKGVFIMTHSATSVKKQQLDEISKRLKLNLKVDII